MKTKAVIFRPDHQNDIFKVRKMKGNKFTHPKTKEDYLIDEDHFQVTRGRGFFGLFKGHYATYYYRKGTPTPLPVPGFEDIKNIGLSSRELNRVFNEEFYHMTDPAKKSNVDLLFYLVVGIAIAEGYGLYRMLTGV